MPEPPDPAVTVREGVAELELKMEDARGEQRMHPRILQPAEHVGHHFRNVCRPRAGVNQGVSVEHAYITSAEAPRLGDEPDSTKWHCNNLNSMFGNWMALLLLYIVPLFLPGVRMKA